MTERHRSAGELRSDDLGEWLRENETEILAWTRTVTATHYYRRMLLVVTALAFTAASAALSGLMLGNPDSFILEGVASTEFLYHGAVSVLLASTVAGVVVAVREYSRRNMSTRAATLRAIQIVRCDTDAVQERTATLSVNGNLADSAVRHGNRHEVYRNSDDDYRPAGRETRTDGERQSTQH